MQHFKAMGISTGGMTLLHMATSQRERIVAMVVIGATTYFPAQARAIMIKSTPESLTETQVARLRESINTATSRSGCYDASLWLQ